MATSKEQVEMQKRGRPAISQDIMRLIEDRVNDDMEQPIQLPIRVLAYRIHEALKKAKKKNKKMKIPAVSTIEKIIPKIRKEPDPQEQSWDIFKLRDRDNPIPSEALPLVLHLWVAKRERLGRHLTVREAQWAGRLYALAKDMPLSCVGAIIQCCAMEERSFKWSKLSPRSDYSLELAIFELITGQKISRERAEKILGHKEITPELIDPELCGNEMSDKLGEMMSLREFLREMGGKNESSNLLQSKHRRPGTGRNEPRKSTGSMSKKSKRAELRR